jgi:hypothetical protein
VASHDNPFSEGGQPAAQPETMNINRHLLEHGEQPLLQRDHIKCKFSGKNVNKVRILIKFLG